MRVGVYADIRFKLWCFFRTYFAEAVHLPLCDSYNTTSFRSPNVFNHTSQEEAIFHMHTFSPLVVTFCHRHLILFLCLVHIPWYLQAEDSPPVLQPACRSLCDDVYSQCKYTMDKLHFHWPDAISCDKFGNATSCIAEGQLLLSRFLLFCVVVLKASLLFIYFDFYYYFVDPKRQGEVARKLNIN